MAVVRLSGIAKRSFRGSVLRGSGAKPDKAAAWVSTGALLNRVNFAVALTGNQVRGAQVDIKSEFQTTPLRRFSAILMEDSVRLCRLRWSLPTCCQSTGGHPSRLPV